MKTPEQVLVDIGRRVSTHWHHDLTTQTATWPHTFPLGAATKTDLTANFGSFHRQAVHWRDWACNKGLPLTFASRHVAGTVQSLPTHVTVADLDTAAGLLGPEWKRRVQRGRHRADQLAVQFPNAVNPGTVLRAMDGYSDTDFELLCLSAIWFTHHTASGLTPRQVPIEGLHTKWLNTHKPLLHILTGLDDLDLLPRHPRRLHFTYLDPDHLATGGRKHDSATVADHMTPAYLPDVIVISENKDTAIHFPELANAISVEGAGFGAADAAVAIDWITTCPHLIYWGDMDASGLEIVNLYRQSGIPITTILMDLQTFTTYERFGSTTDTDGNPLTVSDRKPLPWLTEPERELYDALTDSNWEHCRRIEQERIPLVVALDAVQSRIMSPPANSPQ